MPQLALAVGAECSPSLEGSVAVLGRPLGSRWQRGRAGNKPGEQRKREGPESGPQLGVRVALPWAGALRMHSGGSCHVSM